MVGWHHQLNGHQFEQILGDGEEQGSLVGRMQTCSHVSVTIAAVATPRFSAAAASTPHLLSPGVSFSGYP